MPKKPGMSLVLHFTLALVFQTSPIRAQPEEPPLFGGSVVPPEYLATLTVGMGAPASTAPLAVVATIRAGEDPQLSAWQVRDPLTDPAVRVPIGVAMLVQGGIQGNPCGLTGLGTRQLALLHVGHFEDLWTLRDPDWVPPPSRGFLLHVKDGRGIPPTSTGDAELLAYADLIAKAAQTSTRGFLQGAKRDVTYAHLMENPDKYRGEVIFLQGQLKRVRRFDPPLMLQGEQLTSLYEGWIFYQHYGPKAPYVVLFTELPAGIEVKENMDVKVEFAGYFYKKYRYLPAENVNSGERRDVPMLIGHSVLPVGPLPATGPGLEGAVWPRQVLPWFLGGFVILLILVFMLTLWYRRNDRKVLKKLSSIQTSDAVFTELEQEGSSETPDSLPDGAPPEGLSGDRFRLHRPDERPEP